MGGQPRSGGLTKSEAAPKPVMVKQRSGGLHLIEPGMRVSNPARPDWGVGQVQSVVGARITINFENAGKLLINASLVPLDILP